MQVVFLPLMGFHAAWLQWVFEGKLLSLQQGLGGALCFLGLFVFVGGKVREPSVIIEVEGGRDGAASQPLLGMVAAAVEEG